MSKLKLLAPILAFPVMASAIDISGDLELDTTYNDIDGTDAEYDQGGRVKVVASASREASNGLYVAAKGELLIKTGGDTGSDDVYLEFGSKDSWRIKTGRFEATHMFPEGNDTLIEHIYGDAMYEMDAVRGRLGDDGSGGVNLLYNATSALSLELNMMFGDNEDDATAGDDTKIVSAFRPVIAYNGGNFGFKIGAESFETDTAAGGTATDKTGYGVNINFSAGGGTYNFNATSLNDKSGGTIDEDVTTLGLNGQWGGFTVGAYLGERDVAGSADPEVTTVYAAYKRPFIVDNSHVTFALSNSSGDDVGTDDSRTDFRVRFNYSY